METYKVTMLWEAWTPQVQSRVVRDALSLQRVTAIAKTQLIVVCDGLAKANLIAMGVEVSNDWTKPDMCLVYVVKGLDIPDELHDRIPIDVEPRVISLYGLAPPAPRLIVEDDPYAGVKFHKTFTRIPETMPLGKQPPKGKSEPLWGPFL